jgi:putative membrane-bound dehydrogenase-like protein
MKNFCYVSFLLIFSFSACQQEKLYTDALSPEQAVQSFRLHDDFTVDLFAAEPHVLDPVEMIFDAEGNIFVVEMPDYPFKPEKGQAGGRIKMLVDSDGDGQIDQSSVFADGLSEATSVLPWKDGLLVTAAPDILYLQDTDGDQRANVREVLFTGFFENNSEAQITNLRYSVDNWIYAANHGQAGEVSFSRKPDASKLSMQGGDFRFRLDKEAFELTSGPAQFGQAINDWGHRFITQNTIHIRHAVMPKRYMERHEHMPSSTVALNISDHDLRMYQDTPPPYWRAERTRRRQKRYDEEGLDRIEYAEDHFTGSSGATFYGGDAFPKEFYGNIFTGDVAGNLIHRDVLLPHDSSPTYTAVRHTSEQDKEFLSSTDPWFRPANFAVGPDGYLYVIDMYRQHIETPLSIPEDLKEDMDFLNGMDKGRIYRIRPKDAPAVKATSPRLKDKPSAELAGLLSHPNQWWRLQAQRLLLERQDALVVPEIEKMLKQHEDARTRLHALYVLEGLGMLNAQHVQRAMQDAHPGLREHGVMLSERFPALADELVKVLNDEYPRVAFQAALSLGQFTSQPGTTDALADLLIQRGSDEWFRTAVLSSDAGSSVTMMQALEDQGFFEVGEDWKADFTKDISSIITARNEQDEVTAYLQQVQNFRQALREAAAEGIIRTAERQGNEVLKALAVQLQQDPTQMSASSIKSMDDEK